MPRFPHTFQADLDQAPCLLADPDISGIGIRSSIYVQTLLSFLPAIWAFLDRSVTKGRLESIEAQSMTILITAFALLLSAIIQARVPSLSNFHAFVILNLSWMNNTNALIYFFLFIHHKAQNQQIPLDWPAWKSLLLFWKVPRARLPGAYSLSGSFRSSFRSILLATYRHVSGHMVLTMGSFHLFLLACLGIWLWTNPANFGNSTPCAMDLVTLSFIGLPVPLSSRSFRIFSLIIYGLIFTPVLNFAIPACVFLTFYVSVNRTRPYNPCFRPVIIGLAILLVLDIIFILTIEHTLRRNRAIQEEGESSWTFGQILAVLLLLIPIRDSVKIFHQQRDKQLRKEWNANLRKAMTTESVVMAREAVEKGADVNLVITDTTGVARFATVLQLAGYNKDEGFVNLLIDKGADVNYVGGKYGTALQATIQPRNRSWKIMEKLLAEGATTTINTLSYDGMTALHRAAHQGCPRIVERLLSEGALVDIPGAVHQYGSAVQACCSSWHDNIEVLTALLKFHAEVDAKGGKYGTALQAASNKGHLVFVRFLVDNHAEVNREVPSDENHHTALQAAAAGKPLKKHPENHLEIVRYLIDRGANVHARGGKYITALNAAMVSKNGPIADLLRLHGAT